MYGEGISLVSVKLYSNSFSQPLDQDNNTIFGSEVFVRGCMRVWNSVQGKDICTSMGIIVKVLVHKCPQNTTSLIEYKLRFPCNLLHDCHAGRQLFFPVGRCCSDLNVSKFNVP